MSEPKGQNLFTVIDRDNYMYLQKVKDETGISIKHQINSLITDKRLKDVSSTN